MSVSKWLVVSVDAAAVVFNSVNEGPVSDSIWVVVLDDVDAVVCNLVS